MTRVKICGITKLDDARCAAGAGADFLGFVFYRQSARFVPPERAATIARAIRREFGPAAPRFVGVFVNETVEHTRTILNHAGLDLAQLHGDEPPEQVRGLSPRGFKALRPQSAQNAEKAAAAYGDVLLDDPAFPQLLIDAYHPHHFGGTGERADWTVARSLARRFRLLLAGGLTPTSVGPAIQQTLPWGVDVSSGVECARGIKDHARVRAFVRAVHDHADQR
jgi:phosphoribosylanthranilate isomerase